MRWLTLALSGLKLISTADFLDFGSGGFRSRLKPGTLTADNDLTLPIGPGTIALTNAKTEAIAAQAGTGLIKSTGANTAAIVATSATIDNLLGAADQAAVRGVIGAVSALYVQSRGQNLVTNGSGLLGDNTNFSVLTFDASELFAGGGSFRCPANAYYSCLSDEPIPVDPTLTYQLSFYAKNGNASGGVSLGSANYSGIAAVDIDGFPITPDQWMPKPGTETTLAAPLNPGNTTITLTSAANWQNGGSIYDRGLRWWPYVNSKGYSYPPHTYSRNSTRDSWAAGGISGNVITLSTPWTGPALPAGTPIENSSLNEGSYKYFGMVGSTIPATWTNFSGEISGIDTTRLGGLKFPPGTAFIRLVFLFNYSPPSNAVIHINSISFTSTVPSNLRYLATPASAVQNSSIFLDPATGKLAFKNSAGIVNQLY